jgi:hypothetical protein
MSDVTIEYETIRGDKDFSEKVAPDRLLDRIDDIKRRFQDGLQAPYGVDVVNDKGDRMTVGFDESEGFLMLQPGSDREWTQRLQGLLPAAVVRALEQIHGADPAPARGRPALGRDRRAGRAGALDDRVLLTARGFG